MQCNAFEHIWLHQNTTAAVLQSGVTQQYGCTTGSAFVSWNFDSVDVCFMHRAMMSQHFGHFSRAHIFTLPPESVPNAITEPESAVVVKPHHVTSAKIDIAFLK